MAPRPSRAFTTVELLVAISIIIVLAGILLIGMSVLRGTQGGAATEVDLKNLQAMLSEFDATSRMGSRTRPGQWFRSNGTLYAAPADPTAGPDFWRQWNDTGAAPLPFPAPGDVREGQSDRTTHPAILNTAVAMARLQSVPAVRQMVESLSADRQMRLANHATSDVDESQYPIPLDAWGNPIIFVPGGGLNVHLISITGAAEYPAAPTPNSIVISPEGQVSAGTVVTAGRPFWASAGPDGDFMKGDDNLYSFEK
jgi:type II secretory pathway pseudopilin PulG